MNEVTSVIHAMPPRILASNLSRRTLDPLAAARPTEAFLICTAALQVVYASKGLDELLLLPTPDEGRDTALPPLLQASLALDRAANQTILAQLEGARAIAADCSFDVLSAAPDPRPISVQIQRVGEANWIISFTDLGARRAAEERVVTMTMTDPLTGLGNRMRFRQSLTQALSAAPGGPDRVALILIDLDRFKAVNDTLGHPAGDQLLRKVSDRLLTLIRQKDMLARLGGDEFAAWIPCTPGGDELARRAARIVDLLGRPFLIEGMQVNIGASVGIAIAPQDGGDYETLMKSADLALYAAKASGRSTYSFFDPAMEQRAQDRRQLELDLRRALALRQFELHYRPQIDIETRSLVGLEALVRWRHPQRGLIEPSGFMAVADEIGLTASIGKWILTTACQDAADWTRPVKVVVALCAPQFATGSLTETVQQALAAAPLDAARLELEITESVLLQNESNVVKALHELKAGGVRIGISDFGTGYASLTKLDSFPFDRIKLDTALLADALLEQSLASQRAIISAVVAFGASLGVNTMLDGIRTPAELAEIRLKGGQSVQGFMASRTVSALEVAAWLSLGGTDITLVDAAHPVFVG